jgi:hypothetical protein
MAEHKTGTREAWQAARDELLAMKKKLTQRYDQLAEKRRELPWVPIEKNYTFETDEGTRTLAQLFDGRPDRYRYDARFRPTEGVSGVRRSRHPQRSGKGGGRHLPRSPVRNHGCELAQRCGRGGRASVCGARGITLDDGRSRRHCRPEGCASDPGGRRTARARDRWTWNPDRLGALVGSRTHAADVKRHRSRSTGQAVVTQEGENSD